ncbi:hypothetical protein U9M48_001527 [Paspalum notatum var. saurae]|uniref:Uncharacterized protein n=1 Tax=Paspalum notatum var. saurae TaxID=547442 RepID=A0AAQ3SJ24_PASNO
MTTGWENLISQSPSSSSPACLTRRYKELAIPPSLSPSRNQSFLALFFACLTLACCSEYADLSLLGLELFPLVGQHQAINLQQNMEREQMRVAILKQEQIFRQQVHELHRLYHVQKQLMMQQQAAQVTAPNRAPAVTTVVDVKPRPQLDVWRLVGEKTTNPPHQLISFTGCNNATTPAPALSEECHLELTLATGGPSSSSSNSCDAQGRQGKRLKASSNSESGATAVSSTSTESELAQFGDVDVTMAVRLSAESRGIGQGAWMYQCLSLKMA